MFQEIGQVVSTEGRKAQVRVTPSEACAQCGRCGLASLSKREDVLMDAWNDVGAKAGESVLIEVQPRDYLTAHFVVYVAPILSGIVGYAAGAFVGSQAGINTSSAGIVGAIFSFLLSFAGIKAYDNKLSRENRFLPRIVENLSASDDYP